jgi:hypothetical protein
MFALEGVLFRQITTEYSGVSFVIMNETRGAPPTSGQLGTAVICHSS